jgi:hypothetical protein
MEAYKAATPPGYNGDKGSYRAACKARASLERAAARALEALLADAEAWGAIRTDLPGLHRRVCPSCKRMAWYAVNRVGYIACTCGQQVTTKIEQPPAPAEPEPQPKIDRRRRPPKPPKPPREQCQYVIKTPKTGYHAYLKRTGIVPKTRYTTHRCTHDAMLGSEFCYQHHDKDKE